jgi:Ca-activated chloride channel family protein
MHDGDEIAIVRYSSEAQLLQPLSRVGDVRESLRARVRSLTAAGGTNIPWGLSAGVDALRDAGDGRVRRVVLVSDGLDESRAQAEGIAQRQAQRGVTLSSLGIGLDFDESYLSGVSRAGHGNFGFVQNASSLQRFLARELKETAGTVVEGAVARLRLPSGVRMVRLVGADGEQHGDELEIRVGSVFAGAQRSVVVELEVDADLGDQLRFDTRLSWQPVGGSSAEARFATLKMVASADEDAVADARDGEIYARAVSALASWKQLRAVEAFGRGDREEARRLIDANIRELKQAAKAAPEAADELDAQVNSYDASRTTLSEAAPASPAARAAAKRAYEKNTANLSYEAF